MTVIAERCIQRVRHELVYRTLKVARVQQLTPCMLRVTFTGDQLEGFHSPAFDDHVKIFFPLPGQHYPVLPIAGPDGPLPPPVGVVSPARSYTPRHFDPVTGELDIDMVLHGDGPAMTWVASARPGDVVGIGGPRRSFLLPDELSWQLMMGDETALPAISRRLERLPVGTDVTVAVEVANARERLPLNTEADLRVTWLTRDGAEPGTTTALDEAVRSLDIPTMPCYIWGAGESRQMRGIRSYLQRELGIEASRMRVTGYWTRGIPDHVE